jgi:hypothetical protein
MRRVLVVGGANGIGLSIATELANRIDVDTVYIVDKASTSDEYIHEKFETYQFDPDMPRFQDFELLYRISKNNSIYCLDEALVDYLVGDDSISRNNKRLIQASKLLLEKHPQLCKDQPRASKSIARMLWSAWLYNRKEADFDAKTCIRLALTYNHSAKYIVKTIMVYVGLYNLYRKLLPQE